MIFGAFHRRVKLVRCGPLLSTITNWDSCDYKQNIYRNGTINPVPICYYNFFCIENVTKIFLGSSHNYRTEKQIKIPFNKCTIYNFAILQNYFFKLFWSAIVYELNYSNMLKLQHRLITSVAYNRIYDLINWILCFVWWNDFEKKLECPTSQPFFIYRSLILYICLYTKFKLDLAFLNT